MYIYDTIHCLLIGCVWCAVNIFVVFVGKYNDATNAIWHAKLLTFPWPQKANLSYKHWHNNTPWQLVELFTGMCIEKPWSKVKKTARTVWQSHRVTISPDSWQFGVGFSDMSHKYLNDFPHIVWPGNVVICQMFGFNAKTTKK